MDFLDLLTKAGPFVISAGGVAACVWMAVKIVPEERKSAGLEREAARKDYLDALNRAEERFITTLTHISDQDHQARHEMANKISSLVLTMYNKFGLIDPEDK